MRCRPGRRVRRTHSACPLPASPLRPNPDQVIDQVFDFAEQMLAVQRQFAKNMAAVAKTDQSKS